MADQNRPTEGQAPDPTESRERANPQKQSGLGNLDAPKGTPEERPDRIDQAVDNKHASRQVNAEDVQDAGEAEDPARNESGRPGTDRTAASPNQSPPHHRRQQPLAGEPDHSMQEEEPLGWDQAPEDIHDSRDKRHPRTGGKGGTPDAGEPRDRG